MTAPTSVKPARTPKNVAQATELLERVARLDGQVAAINAGRDAAIAETNAVSDALLLPVVQERVALAAVIEAWWSTAGAALLPSRRKTMELGGCVIGSKAAPLALTFGNSDDFDVAVERLREQRWAKAYVRVTYAVEKKAVKEALDGKHGEQLRGLGFGTRGGAPAFVLEAVKQAGTAVTA